MAVEFVAAVEAAGGLGGLGAAEAAADELFAVEAVEPVVELVAEGVVVVVGWKEKLASARSPTARCKRTRRWKLGSAHGRVAKLPRLVRPELQGV